MQRHWQKRPLLVRGAFDAGLALPGPADLMALATQEGVESRLVRRVRRTGEAASDGWTVRHGPLPRRSMPARRAPDWTLLVQGVDLHRDDAHALLQAFRFIPDARLDDLMMSFATEGGGVGPHVDAYDVFLLQCHGQRRWKVGRARDGGFVADLPLRILSRFEPQQEWLCEPGDLLYIPPGWGHDGVAEGGECVTASVGFRAPAQAALGTELLQRLLDAHEPPEPDRLYRDAQQGPVRQPAAIPEGLQRFAADCVRRWLGSPAALERELALALGEALSEPKAGVWFDPPAAPATRGATTRRAAPVQTQGVRLDRRTRMLYDTRCLYVNGEAFTVGGTDARLLRRLADARELDAATLARLGPQARDAVAQWLQAGWLQPGGAT